MPSAADATCSEECDNQYSSAIDDCRSQYGEDPAVADDLASCIQEAPDDYRSCLDDCANAAISLPPPVKGGGDHPHRAGRISLPRPSGQLRPLIWAQARAGAGMPLGQRARLA